MSTMKHDMDQNGKSSASLQKELSGETHTEKKNNEGKRGEKKGLRWTAIDTVILLLVLVALAGVIVRCFVLPSAEDDLAENGNAYYVEFTVREIHTDVLEEFEVSDRFYLYETGEMIGYLGYYDDGSRALTAGGPVSEDNTRFVTADGCLYCTNGKMENGSLLLQDVSTYLTPGAVLQLRTDRAVMTVEITKIRAGA